MAGNYAAPAEGAASIETLQTEMDKINRLAQSDLALTEPLQTAATMWERANRAIDGASRTFHAASNSLVSTWLSPAPVGIYQEAATASQVSMVMASDTIAGTGPGGPSQATMSIPDVLRALATYIGTVAGNVATAKAELDKAIQTFDSEAGALAFEEVFVKLNRPVVVDAGQQLNQLAAEYERIGPQLVDAGKSLVWKGPGAGNTVPVNGPGTGPGTAPGGPGFQGGDQPEGEVPGDAPGGEAPGGAPGGAPGDVPGGTPGGVPVANMPGGTPGGPQGPGLAGMPTAVAPPSIEKLAPPNIPATPNAPGAGLPIGGVPVGGLGGGGLGGAGGVSGKKLDIPKAGGVTGGVGDKPIPKAAERLSPQATPSGGRAPGSSAGAGLAGTSTPGGAGAGGVPPMMPPGAGMGAGGGGRGGKSGASGTIRPVGRQRDRRTDGTPGIPASLRGKAGKDLSGTFPAAPSTSRRRQETAPTETLQLLDEDLWKVENDKTAAQPRRSAN